MQKPSADADQELRGQLPLGLLPVVLHGRGRLRVRPVPCAGPGCLSEQVSLLFLFFLCFFLKPLATSPGLSAVPDFLCLLHENFSRTVFAAARFYFDFSTTYVGAGMICPHTVNVSVLLGGILSWGLLWPLIAQKRGSWFDAKLPDSSLEGMQGYRVLLRYPSVQHFPDPCSRSWVSR